MAAGGRASAVSRARNEGWRVPFPALDGGGSPSAEPATGMAAGVLYVARTRTVATPGPVAASPPGRYAAAPVPRCEAASASGTCPPRPGQGRPLVPSYRGVGPEARTRGCAQATRGRKRRRASRRPWPCRGTTPRSPRASHTGIGTVSTQASSAPPDAATPPALRRRALATLRVQSRLAATEGLRWQGL